MLECDDQDHVPAAQETDSIDSSYGCGEGLGKSDSYLNC
jgi:hypothetical protein